MQRLWILLTLTLAFAGCSNGGTPATFTLEELAGSWDWDAQATLCPELQGLLDALDGKELFTVTVNGQSLRADFVDAGGNRVEMDATLLGNRVRGTLTVTGPVPQAAPQQQSPLVSCTGRIYVQQESTNFIQVYDLATRSFLKSFQIALGSPLVREPHVTGDGRYYLLPTFGVTNVTHVVDTATDTEVATLPVSGALVESGGLLYVVSGSQIRVFDIANGFTEVTPAIALPAAAVDAYLDATRNRIIAVGPFSGRIMTIDLATEQVVDVAATPINVLAGRVDGDRLWLVGYASVGGAILDLTDPGLAATSLDVGNGGLLQAAMDVQLDDANDRMYVVERRDENSDFGQLRVFDRNPPFAEVDTFDFAAGTVPAVTEFGFPPITICGPGAAIFPHINGPETIDLATPTFEGKLVQNENRPSVVGRISIVPEAGAPPPCTTARRLVLDLDAIVRQLGVAGVSLDGEVAVKEDNEACGAPSCLGESLTFHVDRP